VPREDPDAGGLPGELLPDTGLHGPRSGPAQEQAGGRRGGGLRAVLHGHSRAQARAGGAEEGGRREPLRLPGLRSGSPGRGARLTPFDREFPFDAKLIEQGGKKIELHNEAEAQAVLAALDGAEWKVGGIKKREQRRNPAAPFITSTLQQEAARKLGFSSRRTM